MEECLLYMSSDLESARRQLDAFWSHKTDGCAGPTLASLSNKNVW